MSHFNQMTIRDPQIYRNAHKSRQKNIDDGKDENAPLGSRSVGHVELLRLIRKERE